MYQSACLVNCAKSFAGWRGDENLNSQFQIGNSVRFYHFFLWLGFGYVVCHRKNFPWSNQVLRLQTWPASADLDSQEVGERCRCCRRRCGITPGVSNCGWRGANRCQLAAKRHQTPKTRHSNAMPMPCMDVELDVLCNDVSTVDTCLRQLSHLACTTRRGISTQKCRLV